MKATIFVGTYASYTSSDYELYTEPFVTTDEARAKAWYKNSIVDDIRENADEEDDNTGDSPEHNV